MLTAREILEVSRAVRHIDAFDLSEHRIATLQQRCRREGVSLHSDKHMPLLLIWLLILSSKNMIGLCFLESYGFVRDGLKSLYLSCKNITNINGIPAFQNICMCRIN